MLRARNVLRKTGQVVMSFFGRSWMRMHGCTVHRSAQIYGRPRLWNSKGHVRIGERVVLHSMPRTYPFGQEFSRCVLSSGAAGKIEIDDDACIVGAVIHSQRSVRIGKRVMISPGCRIMDTDMHPVDQVPRRFSFLDPEEAAPIILEDDVWICAGATVCPGVRIGRGSVIGTQSVVTKDIPPMVLAAGVPAKVIRPLRIGENESATAA